MSKARRTGKVFVDWSQNDRHKTTVNVYSLRAMERPTVSTPLTWDEVSDIADGHAMAFTSDAGAGARGRAGRPVRAGADVGAGAAALMHRIVVVGSAVGGSADRAAFTLIGGPRRERLISIVSLVPETTARSVILELRRRRAQRLDQAGGDVARLEARAAGRRRCGARRAAPPQSLWTRTIGGPSGA